MPADVPAGARPVARVLLFDPQNRILLLRALHRADGSTFWVTPGGGVDAGETFEEAANRELREETGLDLQIGPWVWTRRHAYDWNGRWSDQYERFFVARTTSCDLDPQQEDDYVIDKRWWTLDDLRGSSDAFRPRRFVELIQGIIGGKYPLVPTDCDV